MCSPLVWASSSCRSCSRTVLAGFTGDCELIVRALVVTAAGAARFSLKGDWGTGDRAKRAEDAAITYLWLKCLPTIDALIEPLTRCRTIGNESHIGRTPYLLRFRNLYQRTEHSSGTI